MYGSKDQGDLNAPNKCHTIFGLTQVHDTTTSRLRNVLTAIALFILGEHQLMSHKPDIRTATP